MTLAPGSTVGVFGSGQLGRMLGLAARSMGYGFAVFSPEADSPAGAIADWDVVAPYEDLDAVRAFAERVDVLTFEFENVPAATVAAAGERAPVRPSGQVLHVCQHRLREKRFLESLGLPVAPFMEVFDRASLVRAVAAVGLPAVLKTSELGYDGKGQHKLLSSDDAALDAALAALGGREGVIEGFVDIDFEMSVLAARGVDGAFAAWPPFVNLHVNHILDLTVCPVDEMPPAAADAEDFARAILQALGVVGVLCVELFVTRQGKLLVNELAPRPHNSGHLTIEASATSQFEQQLRSVCGLPLGATTTRPAAMVNLLGDHLLRADQRGGPDLASALALPDVHLHLYGKRAARAGRKMGHLTAVDAISSRAAAQRVQLARERFTRA